ncbi:MAG: FtsX-like permease family protein, partial [Streptosporangiaceae bacterium]
MRPDVPLTVSRMNAYRLVLAAAALTILITSALVAALVSFSGQALSQVAHNQLASTPGTAITVKGQADASQAATDTAGIRAQLRSTFGASGFALYHAQWSELLKLPGHYGRSGTPLTQAVAVPGIGAHAVLVTGSWPGPPVTGQPVPVALPAAAAALLHLSVGDVVPVRQQVSGQLVRVKLTGVFRPAGPAGRTAAFWNLNLIGASGVSSSGGFTTYGPMVVSQAALTSALSVSQGSWVGVPATADIPAGAMATLAGQVGAATQAIQNLGASGGLQVTTELPALLSGIARNLLVARSLLVVAGLLLVLLAGFALTSVARLLATDREGESALLTSRGGSRWQLTRLTVPEVALLTVAAAAAGCVAGGWLAIWLSRTGPLRFADLRLQVFTWDAAGAVVVTAAFAALILLSPVLRTLTPGAARVRRGRQAAIAGMARSGADLALVVLAGLAVWQLHDSLIVAPSANGTTGIDPVLALAPALAVGAGTVILVRLLPLLAKIFDRLASRGARLPLSLASWQVSRHPIRQAGVALLVVMSVATGTLALSEHQSWTRSAQDQASFSAGAEVRVDTASGVSPAQAGAIAGAPGVAHAMAAAPMSLGGAEVLAIDARQAASVVLIRRDQTPLAPPALFGAITPSGPAAGATLPGRPSGVSLTLTLGPASLRLGPAPVTVTVADSEGVVGQIPAGTLAGDGRPHVLTASFGHLPAAAYPLRLTAVTLDYTLPYTRPRSGAVLSVVRVAGTGSGWASQGTVLGGWAHLVSSGELTG